MLNSFLNDLFTKFEGKVPLLIWFVIGLSVGIIIFLITILIFYIVSKPKKLIEGTNKKNVLENNPKYLDIINEQKEIYNSKYKQENIETKIDGLAQIILSLLNDISSLYYPYSTDPIFEISITQLIDFIDYMTKRIDYTVDRVLTGKLRILDILTKYTIKDKKLNELLNDKKKEEESKFSKFIKKGATKIGLKIGSSMIDSEVLLLIEDLGNDINKLYRNEELIFTLISMRQSKLERDALALLDKVGDDDEN